MKLVILAGGLGTRLSEITQQIPKPMVLIGGKPFIWHIMKYYSHFGINEFIVCVGYKGYMLKDYFIHYSRYTNDITVNTKSGEVNIINNDLENWKIHLINTGEKTQTGGRILRVKEHLGTDDFCMTYGDGLSDINLSKLFSFHKKHNKKATVTSVAPLGRFGALSNVKDDLVTSFSEKPQGDGVRINGGFFVLTKDIFDHIIDDDTTWEQEPLRNLAKEKQLVAYRHDGFWHCMDTLKDRNTLEELWSSGNAPWNVWNN